MNPSISNEIKCAIILAFYLFNVYVCFIGTSIYKIIWKFSYLCLKCSLNKCMFYHVLITSLCSFISLVLRYVKITFHITLAISLNNFYIYSLNQQLVLRNPNLKLLHNLRVHNCVLLVTYHGIAHALIELHQVWK